MSVTTTTSSTAPWDAGTPARLPFTLGQRVDVTAHHPDGRIIDVQLQGGTLTWDEGRAPRVDLLATARVPEDQATLDALDPRAGVRLQVRAGYTRTDRPRSDDVHLVADLGLRSRRVLRPSNVLELRAASDEALVLDEAPVAPLVIPAGTRLAAAVRQVLLAALPGAVIVEDTLPTGPMLTEVVHVRPEQDWWSALDDLVDRFGDLGGLGADVFDDGLRAWHLRPRPTLAGDPAHELTVGTRGTITSSTTSLERDAWHNAVQLVYRWTETELITTRRWVPEQEVFAVAETVAREVPHEVTGTAQLTGPFAPGPNTGRRVFRDTRDVRTTQAAADAAAAAVLARRSATGRALDLEAIAAWWLRPGATAAARLPTGDRELHLATSVAFDLTTGRMRVGTRLPDDAPATTPGA